MPVEIVRIEWTKPQAFDQALTQAESQQGGLYALLKVSRAVTTLSYIGKSIDFHKRFGTHRNSTSHMMSDAELKKCFVTFGIISSFEQSQMSHNITPEQLKDAESFYINHYRPLGNDPSTKKGYKGNTIISFNTGKCFQKQKIISNSESLIKLLKYYF
jgi:hypothetical protein